MLAALAPNPEDEAEDEDDEEEPAVPQIELPQPTGAALAWALVKHQKGARCEARGFLVHGCQHSPLNPRAVSAGVPCRGMRRRTC